LDFLHENPEVVNYSASIFSYSESVKSLINDFVLKKVSSLLNAEYLNLESIELHIQRANCPPIPPHQDNFYHCIDPKKGLKVLVPLDNLSPANGGLIYLDYDNNYPVLEHKPSNIENFSAIIEKKLFDKLEFKKSSYELNIGDSVFHFMNSIHYSLGNSTSKDSLFIVYRFQSNNVVVNKEAEKKYEECYKQHLKIIRN
jgi:hypothetical protein